MSFDKNIMFCKIYCVREKWHITKHTVLTTVTVIYVYIISHVICLVMSASSYRQNKPSQIRSCIVCFAVMTVCYTSNYGCLPSKKKRHLNDTNIDFVSIDFVDIEFVSIIIM